MTSRAREGLLSGSPDHHYPPKRRLSFRVKLRHPGGMARGQKKPREIGRKIASAAVARGGDPLPAFVGPQLALLKKEPPSGASWVHELKLDGYRIHARIDRGEVKLLTRNGLDWSPRYGATAEALRGLKCERAYLDGELCAVNPDGTTSFAAMQAATDTGRSGDLVFFLFDLLHLDGVDARPLPLTDRKAKLAGLLEGAGRRLVYHEHLVGDGRAILEQACKLKAEGIVSKQADAPYAPGNRGLWVKTKCLNRQEFVVVGWTEGEGARRALGSLLLGYYEGGRLVYAGRAGTGLNEREIRDLRQRLKPLAVAKMPLASAPPRDSRFGRPLELKRVHWVRPDLVVEITYLTLTADGLVRQAVYQGLREDKRARDVRLEGP
jgi:bifunctional non-homologous end joining protein LigD